MNETISNSASSGAVSKEKQHPCYPCMMARDKVYEHVRGIPFLLSVCLRRPGFLQIRGPCIFGVVGGVN